MLLLYTLRQAHYLLNEIKKNANLIFHPKLKILLYHIHTIMGQKNEEIVFFNSTFNRAEFFQVSQFFLTLAGKYELPNS